MSTAATAYPRVTAREVELITANFHKFVNTGGPLEHVLDLLNDFRRENNRDLSVNLLRYLLGYGIDCQVRLLAAVLDAEGAGHVNSRERRSCDLGTP